MHPFMYESIVRERQAELIRQADHQRLVKAARELKPSRGEDVAALCSGGGDDCAPGCGRPCAARLACRSRRRSDLVDANPIDRLVPDRMAHEAVPVGPAPEPHLDVRVQCSGSEGPNVRGHAVGAPSFYLVLPAPRVLELRAGGGCWRFFTPIEELGYDGGGPVARGVND